MVGKIFKKTTIGIELAATMQKDKALGIPFEKWNGYLPLHTMLNTCNNCSPKSMFTNFVGGERVGKPSPKTSFKEQTTSKGLKQKINLILEF